MEKTLINKKVSTGERTISRLWTGATPMRRSFRNRIKNLQFLPVSLFGAVMGVAGHSLAWRSATFQFGAPGII